VEEDKLSGRVIIDTILANMRQQVEELRYSKVVPAAYDVYLHGDDQQRFDSLSHEIAAEAVRALQETLDGLNGPSRLDRVREMVKKPRLPFKKVGPWVVRIARDPDGAVPRGRALVVSQITLASSESYEGQRTRRLATLSEPVEAGVESRAAHDRITRFAAERPTSDSGEAPRTVPAAESAAATRTAAQLAETRPSRVAPGTASLAWSDDTGAHRFTMTALETTLGRATRDSTADVRLATLPDVSRLHARIRRHPETDRYTIEDLSLLGTSVNGRRLEKGAPHELPSTADIRLADAITLRFESERLP
jgi:hypothetical protein